MKKIIKCECGYVVSGDSDDEVVADAQQHAREVHGMEISRDQVLSMAQLA